MFGSLSTRRSSLPQRTDLFESLRGEMDDVLARFFGGGDGDWLSLETPKTDVSETENSVIVRMDVPGFEPDNIHLETDGKVLTVRGQQTHEEKKDEEHFHRVERRASQFSRSVPLPTTVAREGVEALCRKGVLTVTLPKQVEAGSNRIPVKS